jgi:DNA-binding transcriptional ArsR family regulator
MRPLQQNDVFHAIAHPARRAILALLKNEEKTAGELAEPFHVTFAAISQHLKVLKDANLLSERREGRRRIYTLRPRPLADVASWVHEFERFFEARLDALAAHLDRKHGRKKRRATRRARNHHGPESK